MPEESTVQTTLRCEQCNKPFDKRTTLIRHGYYCRSRKVGRNTRSRSCIACARGKARCDNGQPSCSRCATKPLQCHYPGILSSITRSPNVAPRERQSTSPLHPQDRLVVSDKFDVIAPPTLMPELAAPGPQMLDWNDTDLRDLGQNMDREDPTISFADFLIQPSDTTAVQEPTPSVGHHLQSQQAIVSYSMSIPAIPTMYSLRSLVPRSYREPGQQRIAGLVLHTLKSYPLMIMHHNTLPPFIHPRSMPIHSDNDNMEPLANCLSLMHMIGCNIRGSRKLFWKNVRMECERLHEELAELNNWELLAAMQALSVYLLVRLQEGETEYNNYDYLMLTTVAAVAKEFARTESGCDVKSACSTLDPETNWKAWIFLESRGRLAVIYRIVDMLVYFEPSSMCDLQKDLIIAPLPAKKQLWEADNERAWGNEGMRDNAIYDSFALTANGELVRLDGGQLFCGDGALRYKLSVDTSPTSSSTNWSHWCSGMDGFGGLIMLAASLMV